jgi:hypothetical protein
VATYSARDLLRANVPTPVSVGFVLLYGEMQLIDGGVGVGAPRENAKLVVREKDARHERNFRFKRAA